LTATKIKNIIFDLGNTLLFFDFEYFYDGISKLEKNLNPTHLRRFIKKRNLGSLLTTAKISHLQFFRILKRKFNLKVGFKDFMHLYCDIFWENKPMLNLIENLYSKKVFRIFLMSNTDSRHMLFINRNFPQINLFKHKILSYKVKMMKPSRKIYQYIINRYNLNASETLFIDDLKVNIKSAKLFGFTTIHYNTFKSFNKNFNSLFNK
jgi:HAD superfamily hydrolase (TIGR01509 family)